MTEGEKKMGKGIIKKGLCGLVLSTTLLMGAVEGVGLSNEMFPAGTGTQYRENAVNKGDAVIDFRGVKMLGSYFDVDGDGLYEISELRRILAQVYKGEVEETYLVSEQPMFYAYDGDGDNVYNVHEILIDEAEDGLNGNEMILKNYLEGEDESKRKRI